MEKQIDTPTNTPTKSQYTNCEIEEMAKAVCHLDRTCDECMTSFECKAMMYAKRFYNAGYRKIYDDHQRQCTCYALGCQMAEQLKSKVAEEIFEEIEEKLTEDVKDSFERVNRITDSNMIDMLYAEIATLEDVLTLLAELKKKYTESEGGE